MSSACSAPPRDPVSVEIAAEQVDAHPETMLTRCTLPVRSPALHQKGTQMANPSPKVENLRPPWPRGTSGNPAGYSRGRRISDAIKTQIEEMGLDREFAATAIAKALGQEHVLKQKVQDPETGEDIWVELKPNIAWFKMIMERIEPVAQKPDDMAVLNALRAEYDRELRAQVDQSKASECPERSRSDPGA